MTPVRSGFLMMMSWWIGMLIDDSMSRDETDEDDYWYHAPIERQPEFIEDSSMSWDEADEDDAY